MFKTEMWLHRWPFQTLSLLRWMGRVSMIFSVSFDYFRHSTSHIFCSLYKDTCTCDDDLNSPFVAEISRIRKCMYGSCDIMDAVISLALPVPLLKTRTHGTNDKEKLID